MPYYSPQEDSHTVFLERTNLAQLFMQGIGYGVQLVLYVICVRYFWRERKRRGSVMLYLLGYVTLLLSLLSLWVAVVTWAADEVYVNNRNYPGGAWAYNTAPQFLPINMLFFISAFSLTFLSDCLVLWRCWIVWSSVLTPRLLTYVVVFFPFVVLLASFALGIIWNLQSSPPGHPFYDKTSIILAASYYATSIGMNIIVTFLITLRLCLHRRKLLNTFAPNHAKQYLSIVAILVESATLYSVVSLAFIVCYALNSPLNPLFLALSPTCQQIAGYLIILRVARGRAWGTKTLEMTSGVVNQFDINISSNTSTEPMEMMDVQSFRHRSTTLTAVSRSHSH